LRTSSGISRRPINIAGLLKIWDFGTFLCLIGDAIRSPGRLKRIATAALGPILYDLGRLGEDLCGARYGLEFLLDVPLDTAATTTGFRYHGPLEHGRADQRKCGDKTDERRMTSDRPARCGCRSDFTWRAN
jgi:hypothetical protein